nr:TldD/PmbA family protein [Candidatus Njordarchaeum guaymaensis]
MKSKKSSISDTRKSDSPSDSSLAAVSARAVAQAEKIGATQAEAFALRSTISTCFIEKLEVTSAQRKVQTGIGIRVALGKRIGFSCTSSLSEQSIKETIEKALKIAHAREEDPRFKTFQTQGSCQKVLGIFDKRVRESQTDELISEGRLLAEASRNYDKRIHSGSGSLRNVVYDRTIANSLGVELEESDTVVSLEMSVMAKDNSEVSSGAYAESARSLGDVGVERVGFTASRLAVEQLRRKPIETKAMDLVMHSYAIGDLLSNTLHPAFMGDNLIRSRTPFAGKLAKKVVSELVSVDDSGVVDKGLATQSFDDEGTPTRRTPLIEKGVVKSFLYDSIWANQAKTQSTGNASRKAADGLRTYGSEPVIDTTNIVVKPGNKSFEELVSEIDAGILTYYVSGAHTANQVSGAFSVAAETAFKIEHGEITYPVKEAMIGGDLIQLLSKVSQVANDVRASNFNLRYRVTITPSIRFSDIKISA